VWNVEIVLSVQQANGGDIHEKEGEEVLARPARRDDSARRISLSESQFHGVEDFREWIEKKLGLPCVTWIPDKTGHRRFVSGKVEARKE